jgi:hypothetical protein
MKAKCWYCQYFDFERSLERTYCAFHKKFVQTDCDNFVREPGSDDDLDYEEMRELYGEKKY